MTVLFALTGIGVVIAGGGSTRGVTGVAIGVDVAVVIAATVIAVLDCVRCVVPEDRIVGVGIATGGGSGTTTAGTSSMGGPASTPIGFTTPASIAWLPASTSALGELTSAVVASAPTCVGLRGSDAESPDAA